MRSIFETCFECHDTNLPEVQRRRYMRHDFPLKVSPFAENFAESVLTGCSNIRIQREQERVRKHRESLSPEYKAANDIT